MGLRPLGEGRAQELLRALPLRPTLRAHLAAVVRVLLVDVGRGDVDRARPAETLLVDREAQGRGRCRHVDLDVYERPLPAGPVLVDAHGAPDRGEEVDAPEALVGGLAGRTLREVSEDDHDGPVLRRELGQTRHDGPDLFRRVHRDVAGHVCLDGVDHHEPCPRVVEHRVERFDVPERDVALGEDVDAADVSLQPVESRADRVRHAVLGVQEDDVGRLAARGLARERFPRGEPGREVQGDERLPLPGIAFEDREFPDREPRPPPELDLLGRDRREPDEHGLGPLARRFVLLRQDAAHRLDRGDPVVLAPAVLAGLAPRHGPEEPARRAFGRTVPERLEHEGEVPLRAVALLDGAVP